MKKTIISLLLVLALVLCFALTAAPAVKAEEVYERSHPHTADKQVHCVCGGTSSGVNGHDCTKTENQITWDAWSQDNALPPKGNYYLTKDIVFDDTIADITISDKLNLCLNGYSIKRTNNGRTFAIGEGGEVSICDCSAKLENGDYVFSGVITSGANTSSFEGGVLSVNKGKLNLYGGNIVGPKKAKNGGCVIVTGAGAAVNMYNGVVTGGKATLGETSICKPSLFDHQWWCHYGWTSH